MDLKLQELRKLAGYRSAREYNLNDFNGDWRCSEFERPDVTSAGRSVHYIPPRRNYEF